MKIGVVVCSSCGLSKLQAEEHGFEYMPLTILKGDEQFLDGISCDYFEVLNWIREGKKISTSQPSTGLIQELFDKWLKKYDKIIVISVSSGLSSTYENLKQISKLYLGRVGIVEATKGATSELRIAEMVAEFIKENHDLTAIVNYGYDCNRYFDVFIICKSLVQLAKTGRVSKPTAAMAHVLNIKVALIVEGKPRALTKKRGIRKSIKSITQYIADKGNVESIDISNFGYEKELDVITDIVEKNLGLVTNYSYPASVVGAHTGEAVGIFVKYRKKG